MLINPSTKFLNEPTRKELWHFPQTSKHWSFALVWFLQTCWNQYKDQLKGKHICRC